jgi:hypothetical protein
MSVMDLDSLLHIKKERFFMSVWKKLLGWLERLDTADARKSVADDLKHVSKMLFGLFLINCPGFPATLVKFLAERFEVPLDAVHVSGWLLALLGVAAALVRSLAFLLECSAPETEKKRGRKHRK